MSLFLGKIHYWLFNKIVWFENLEKEIIKAAEKTNIDVEKAKKEIEAKYGEITPDMPLEDMIDTGNIHGWLQGKIHSAEGRMAAWVRIITDNNPDDIVKIQNVYITQGIKAANEIKEENIEINTAAEMYNKINDYILYGMPCDRVDEIVENTPDTITWVKTICVHKDIWEKENVSVNQFYKLRDLWIEAFVNTVNSDFQYIKNDNGSFSIKK